MKLEKLSSVKSSYKVLKRKARDDSSLASLLESARKKLKLRRRVKRAKRQYKSLKSDSSSSDVVLATAKKEWYDLRSSFLALSSTSLSSPEKSSPEKSTPKSSTISPPKSPTESHSNTSIKPCSPVPRTSSFLLGVTQLHHSTPSLNSITQLHPITGVKRSDGLYPCTQWIKLGSCKYGSSCKFSHLSNDSSSSSDSTTLKSRKKSKPCFDFLDGRCERGDHCMYQHKALSEVSSKHRENFEISKIIHGKTFKSSEEKLEQIMKLPVSYRQRARRMFFSATSMSSRSSAATSGSAVSS